MFQELARLHVASFSCCYIQEYLELAKDYTISAYQEDIRIDYTLQVSVEMDKTSQQHLSWKSRNHPPTLQLNTWLGIQGLETSYQAMVVVGHLMSTDI